MFRNVTELGVSDTNHSVRSHLFGQCDGATNVKTSWILFRIVQSCKPKAGEEGCDKVN